MKVLILKRIASNPKHGTTGVLLESASGVQMPFALTLEPEWQDNKPNVSCIPTGRYLCKLKISDRFGVTFEITGVHGRTHILFHSGNLTKNTLGCILVGERFDPLGDTDCALLASADGMMDFMKRLEGHVEFHLDIQDCTHAEWMRVPHTTEGNQQ